MSCTNKNLVLIDMKSGMPKLYEETLNQINLQLIKYLVTVRNDIMHVIRQKLEDIDIIVVTPSHHAAYQTKMSSLTPSSTNEKELSRAFIENDDTQYSVMDLHVLLVQMKRLA